MHSFTESLLKVLDVRLAVQTVYLRELLLAQHTNVAVALRFLNNLINVCMSLYGKHFMFN